MVYQLKSKEQLYSMEETLLVGKKVRYSITKQENSTGLIVDKILKVDKVKERTPDGQEIEKQLVVTGYIIQDDVTQELVHVAHWRILKILGVMKTMTGYWKSFEQPS